MMVVCVMVVACNLFLDYAGNVLNVPIMTFVLCVTMGTNINCDIGFIE